mmetsp:Transcript_197/g.489  ORF Transcript_197/g.489 Transcript_197/m.489 type:complete len:374 (-) Transcript_197:90-1211(-)|eukprot:CAMPEP_0173398200 /NCGR_PEP_ID=MMETSP1356-20130122/40814_1 /TAXON_ID=77927 ORGANISM="Hemiselmis virescens, Strain PCC157" /NCGR_SAMPLE_ID=MMETSP1356 /ASSEMBLY_ACC=CAM_ASM_000847 /LENGTH=373 /DNA_ID=CAMNT_0014357637 /DNA_START=126 /DNA_END=1247 /DNA_ORIENTATION=-
MVRCWFGALVLLGALVGLATPAVDDVTHRPSRRRSPASTDSQAASFSLRSASAPPLARGLPPFSAHHNATSVFVLQGDGASGLVASLYQQAARRRGTRVAGFRVEGQPGADEGLRISQLQDHTGPRFTKGSSTNVNDLLSVALPALRSGADIVMLDGLCRAVLLSDEVRKALHMCCEHGVVVLSIAPDNCDEIISDIIESKRTRIIDTDDPPSHDVEQSVWTDLVTALNRFKRLGMRSSSHPGTARERSPSARKKQTRSASLNAERYAMLAQDDARLTASKMRRREDRRRQSLLARMAWRERAREDQRRGAKLRLHSRDTEDTGDNGVGAVSGDDEWSRPSEVDRQDFAHDDEDEILDDDVSVSVPPDHWHST